jgi:hypothetical protein
VRGLEHGISNLINGLIQFGLKNLNRLLGGDGNCGWWGLATGSRAMGVVECI